MNYCTKIIEISNNLAKSKNRALKEFLKSNKDYIFLIESNCKVLDFSVYQKFIDASEATGIHALMWGRDDINKRHDFDDDPYINYYADFVSSFVMFTRKAVKTVGFLDEKMPPNTWQDLEYAKRIGDAELSTPFGQFAAPKDVDSLLMITKQVNYRNVKQLDEALVYWESKDTDDFPIEIKDQKPKNQQITEMV